MIPWRKKTCQAIRKWKKWISTFVALSWTLPSLRSRSESVPHQHCQAPWTMVNGDNVTRHGETAVVFLLEFLSPKNKPTFKIHLIGSLMDLYSSDGWKKWWQFKWVQPFKFILVYNTWPWCTARGVRNRNRWKLCLFQPAGMDPRVEHTRVL